MTISVAPDFVVNTNLAGAQDIPQIAPLQDGRFVMTWYNSSEIGARIFNADGSPVAAEFQANTTTTNTQDEPSVSGLADGRFVMTWSSNDPGATGHDIRARIFNADGSAGSDFIVNTTTANSQFSPAVTGLADGRMVVTWASLDNGTDYNIRGSIINADGTVGGDFVVNTTTANDQSSPTVMGLADGRFVMAWRSGEGAATGDDIRARIFNADGTAGSDFVVNTTTANSQSGPTITSLADGRFVMAWQSNEGAATDFDIRARIFNADGTAGSDFIVNTTTASNQTAPTVTGLADGRFLMAWTSDEGAATLTDIRARLFNADGTAAGGDFIVNSTTTNTQGNPVVAGLADGRIAVTWQSFNGADNDIRATILDPSKFSGTSSSDFWKGGEFSDALYGLSGDDTFDGGSGDDYLNGGDGLDTLIGGAGKDRLEGGTGNDTLLGKADDDRLIGGRGADTLNGGKGADRFIYLSPAEGGDKVQKFVSGDRFVFDNAGFAGLKEGKLNTKAFKSGTNNKAGDASDHFIFRTGDDTLWYDADGKGGEASVLIADLSNNYDLKAGDILVI